MNPNVWIDQQGFSHTTEEMVFLLLPKTTGIVVLEGVTNCGKTQLLRRFRKASPTAVCIYSYRDVVNELIHICEKSGQGTTLERFVSLLESFPCLAIEDIDYIRGPNTQSFLSSAINEAAKTCLIIVTGNYVNYLMPDFLERLDNPMHFKAYALIRREEHDYSV